jgi:CHAT domain-containing protein/Tfp pilus assembly protein PilF
MTVRRKTLTEGVFGFSGGKAVLLNRDVVFLARFLVCALFVACAAGATPGRQAGGGRSPAQRLAQGQTAERTLKGGETHTHVIKLNRGEFLRVLVEQRGINLIVTLRRSGTKLLTVNLLREDGAEPLSYEARETGDYQLEIQAADAKAVGRYSATSLVKPRPTHEDGLRLAAEHLLMKAERLRSSGGVNGLRQALKTSEESLAYWQRLDDRYWHAYTLDQLASLHFDLGDRAAALDYGQQALPLLRAVGERRAAATTLRNIGYVYELRGDWRTASGYYDQSLTLFRETGDSEGQVGALYRNGFAQRGMGEQQKALDYYQQALQISRAMKHPAWEAAALSEIGKSYRALGERQKSLGSYEEASRLYHAARDFNGEADVLGNIGLLHADSGERRKALEFYDRALSLYKHVKDPADEALTLDNAGDAALALNERRKALNYYVRAAARYRVAGDRRGEAEILFNIGWWHSEFGDKRRALQYYSRALPLQRLAGDHVGEARTLDNVGRVYSDLGRADSAARYYERTLALSKSVGDPRGEAVALSDIGMAYALHGNKRKANEYYERSLPLWRAAGDKHGEAITLTNLADNYSDLEEWQKALNLYGQSLPLYESVKDHKFETKTLNSIAEIYLYLGEKQKAIEYFEKKLSLHRTAGNRPEEAAALGRIRDIYHGLGDHRKELETALQILSAWGAAKDRAREASALNDVADIEHSLGEHQKALESHGRALSLWHELKDDRGKADTLEGMAAIYFELGDKRKSLESFMQVLPLHVSAGNRAGEAETLSRIGWCYYFLGERERGWGYLGKASQLLKYRGSRTEGQNYLAITAPLLSLMFGEQQRALAYYRQVVSVGRGIGDRRLAAEALTKMGKIHLLFDEHAEASLHLRRALKMYRRAGDPNGEAEVLNELGMVYLTQPTDLSSLKPRRGAEEGEALAELLYSARTQVLVKAEIRQANKLFRQALAHYRAVKNGRGEARTLVNIGAAHYMLDDNLEALNYCRKALSLIKENPDTEIEFSALYRLMKISEELPSPELAIVFGKQAINVLQDLRSGLAKVDREMGKAFARLTTDPYRELATILIRQGRLLEAEQVLEMLKEEEYFRFVRRDDKVARDLLRRINLAPAERAALERYDKIADDIIRLGIEYARLEAERLRLPHERTAALIAKQDQINKELAAARKTLMLFLDELKKEFGEQDKRVAAVEEGLQAEVKGWKEPRTVVISTVVGKDSLSMILTTQDISRPYVIDKIGGEKFSEERLNELITEFRVTTKSPGLDPRPSGQKLYDLLVKPLEKDLQVAQADTLVWSLDANLRYVPMAALYDSRHGYLAERYANVIITLASRSKLGQHPADKNSWRALGLGVSKPVAGFPALANVREELLAIVRDTEQKDVTGLLDGRRLLNEEFTLAAFKLHLGRYKVIHAATHFSFVPGTRDESLESFLLLGSGEKLTLGQVKDAGTMFDGVELLVLSACETAAGGKGADGREVEGFGALAQKAGARTVLATLWRVEDVSTRELMVKFYRLQAAMPTDSKAGALRRAQMALLRGEITGEAADRHHPRADLIGREDRHPPGLPFPHNPHRPYAHPYYWAPFILIGNWH